MYVRNRKIANLPIAPEIQSFTNFGPGEMVIRLQLMWLPLCRMNQLDAYKLPTSRLLAQCVKMTTVRSNSTDTVKKNREKESQAITADIIKASILYCNKICSFFPLVFVVH